MNEEIIATQRAAWISAHRALWKKAVTPRVKRSVVRWALEVRKMRGGPIAGPNTIPFSTEYIPHTIAQMDACDDPRVNTIVIWGPIRDAKTTSALCAMGRTVTDDPGGIFSVWPTEQDRDKFSEDDVETMIELCLNPYFVEKKHRESGRTKAYKKFTGGSIRLISSGNITAFRGSTVKMLHLPEADALDPESIYKAFGRTAGMADAIKIMESTGTLASEVIDGKTVWHSVIAEHYDRSDQRKWFLECAECHELSVIRYAQIQTRTGDMKDALWCCPRCDRGHEEHEWFKAAQSGLWYPTAGLSDDDQLAIREAHKDARAKQPEIRGFWRNGFNSLLPVEKGYDTKLHEFLAKGEAAKGSKEALKTWTNEIAAELWSSQPENTDPPPWKPMYDRREDYGMKVPTRGLFLTTFTDVHDNRLEILWIAWGRNEESWTMDHVVLPGSVFQPTVWQLWRRELARRFEHALGCDIGLGFGLIDGGDNAEAVYRALQGLAHNPEPGVTGLIRASKGVGQHPHPFVAAYGSVAKNLKGHPIGSWQAKKLLYNERFRMVPEEQVSPGIDRNPSHPAWDLIDEDGRWIPDPREGVIHFNRQLEQEIFEQMVRERPVIEYVKGEEVTKFANPGKLRNEGLDLMYGNLCALRVNKRPWDLLDADLKARSEAKKQPARAEPVPANYGGQSSWHTGGSRW